MKRLLFPLFFLLCCASTYGCHVDQDLESITLEFESPTSSVSNVHPLPVPNYTCARIESLEQVAPELLKANNITLVLIDIDLTIIEEDPTFHDYFNEQKDIIDGMIQKFDKNHFINSSTFTAQQKRHLVEKQIVDIIAAFQAKNIPVIALTAMLGGSYGIIHDMHEFRYQELLSHGINLDKELPLDIKKLNADLSEFYLISLKRGIVNTRGQTKGTIARYVIEHMYQQPDNILFIDDQGKNIVSVATALKKMGIPKFTGYLYRAAYEPSHHAPLDFRIARTQIQLMAQSEAFVSYEDARKVLEEKKKHLEKK